MQWKELKGSGEIFEYLPEIWEAEEKLPRWFREASKTWTGTLEGLLEFAEECEQVWGLFDADTLTTVVYVQDMRQHDAREVHFSVLQKPSTSEVIETLSTLRDILYRQGVMRIHGWVLGKNRPMRSILAAVGFIDTTLRMDKGQTHGSVCRWHLLESRRA